MTLQQTSAVHLGRAKQQQKKKKTGLHHTTQETIFHVALTRVQGHAHTFYTSSVSCMDMPTASKTRGSTSATALAREFMAPITVP